MNLITTQVSTENNQPKGNQVKYILLNPLHEDIFGITTTEMIEALDEFGCSVICSMANTQGSTQMMYYATAPSLKAIEQMCNACGLEGSVVVCTGIYDQLVAEEVIVKH